MKKILIYLIFIIPFLACKEKNEKVKQIEFLQKDIIDNQIESKPKVENKFESINEKECDISSLIRFDSIIEYRERLYGQDIFMFFANMNPACKSNIKYYEFENKIVLKILKSEPKDFVLLLDGQTEDIINYVLSIIENPIDKNINLKNPLSIISNLKNNEIKIKSRVIKSINITINKYK